MYQIIQKRAIWLTISGMLAGASLVALILWGLNLGIDFTGGSLLEIKFSDQRPNITEVQNSIADIDLGSLVIQPVGENGMILRFQDIDEEKHHEVLQRIDALVAKEQTGDKADSPIATATSSNATTTEFTASSTPITTTEIKNIDELRFDAVGPTIGQELKQRSVTAIVIVLIVIVLYIAWAFRQVSKPVASWKYGMAAIIALFHDVIITLGVFAVLGKFYGVEINSAFVAAILTVLGYSVNDTIVVFDRTRENLPKSDEDFEGTINTSVNQTISRSINTSLTTLLVLLSILFFGGDSIRSFVLALSIGVLVGTYSSIFLASPILVIWDKMSRK